MKRMKWLCSDFFLDIFFPSRCVACDEVVGWDETFCPDCEKQLEYLDDGADPFPRFIDGRPVSFDRAAALFDYSGTARDAVLGLKDRMGKRFAEYCGERLAKKLEDRTADIITAVPMNRRKKQDRGYNQAELLAKSLSKHLDKEVDLELLGRHFKVKQQKELKYRQRIEAADKAFFIKDPCRRLDGRSVILCDDIFTTGATADKCSALLKELGAESVTVAVICSTSIDKDE